MADPLCGPSNALQSFQKHSTVDRTLQQDRLTSRQTPSQGFRSSPANGGFLDPEFEAFEAGQLPLDQGFPQHGFTHPPPSLHQAGPSAWASDFQQMHISSPPPQVQYQLHLSDTGQSFADFNQQGMQVSSLPPQLLQSLQQSNMGQVPGQSSSLFRPMGGMHMNSQYMGGYAGPYAGMVIEQQHQQPAEAFDEEAFARAFEEAARSQEATQQEINQDQEHNVELGQDILINESAEGLMADSTEVLDQDRIGADTIHDPLSQDSDARDQQDDPDALSRTAGELLHSVRRNDTSKFQNSQFLTLMRQFRDKDAVIAGDEVVDVRGHGALQAAA